MDAKHEVMQTFTHLAKTSASGQLYLCKLGISYTSSTAQGGGGSFKNRKRIGEIDCCE